MSWAFPDVGDMRRRVIVQNKTETPDGSGGFSVSWSNQATIWAQIIPIKGEKRATDAVGKQLTDVVTHQIYVRYRNDGIIDTTKRISYGSRIFQIHGVNIIEEKQRYLVLLCQEGVGS